VHIALGPFFIARERPAQALCHRPVRPQAHQPLDERRLPRRGAQPVAAAGQSLDTSRARQRIEEDFIITLKGDYPGWAE
jgi:hypothetical protein